MQADFEKRVNPNDKGQQALLEEMRAHVKKVCTQLLSRVSLSMPVSSPHTAVHLVVLTHKVCCAAGGDEEE